MKKLTLSLAVATLLKLTPTVATAETFIYGTPDSPKSTGFPIYAIEQPVEAANNYWNVTGNTLVVRFLTIPGYTATASTPLFIKVALRNGVRFTKAPTLLCNTTAGITAATKVSLGTPNTARATFSMKTGYRMHPTSGYCRLVVLSGTVASQTAYYNIGSVKEDKIFSASIEFKNAFNVQKTSYAGTYLTFQQAAAIAASRLDTANVAANAIIDVKESSKKFTTNTLVSQQNAFVGQVSFNNKNEGATAAALRRNTASPLVVSDMLQTALITIQGNPLNNAEKVRLVTAGSVNKCSVGTTVAEAVPTGGSVTFKITPAAVSAGVGICLQVNGTTAIEPGQLTVTMSGVAANDWTPVFGDTALNIHEVKKNGISFRVLNIPAILFTDDNVPQDKAYVRLYNTNTFVTVVRGVMYASTGTQVGETQILGTLNPKEVVVLDGNTLRNLFGLWEGRARLVIDVEAEDFSVQATIRSRSGVLTNLSSEASD
ncbi:hypothetical protein [Beggiatoa leptomitoformis]|uniref:Uncharacterized protein n=1 Tax=Beggiatoa leptomitoformis TaxID=288004 RepID=A0A2N9Y9X3_9GAMM|nr:hypothetical protein [Beggiatoa leptomitoformis]ALG67314.1 hypothetical protein AL038_05850 [Beggiatoa leptomitoformis]AUI67251.1 hypothetical protein BLE401_00120 [Beggiatoa leptomitoformis]